MERLKQRFPADLDYGIGLDTTRSVSEGVREISGTLWQALVLVILVVFVFLQGWRPTLIPLLAVPVSLIGTFAFFPMFGFSVNTLSLFGLVLAIGLVVDDAIVVVEAVEHHIEEGMTPRDATLKAMEEVSGPVIAIAIILAAVFVPTAFIPGITGRLYQQFALTIAISGGGDLGLQCAVARVPALCALLLRPRKEVARTARVVLSRSSTGCLAGPTDGYVSLSRQVDPQERDLSIAVIVLVGFMPGPPAGSAESCPPAFLPEEDQGFICTWACNCPTPPRCSALPSQRTRWRKYSRKPRASKATLPSSASVC